MIAAYDADGVQISLSRKQCDQPADGRVRHVLDDPVLRPEVGHELAEQQHGGRRIDPDHRGLKHVRAVRQHDDAIRLYPPPLCPILPIEMDDEISRLHAGHGFSNRNHPAGAFSSRRRRERGLQPVAPPTEGDIGGIDRKGNNIEYHFVRGRLADFGTFDAFGDIFGFAESCDLHLFQRKLPRAWQIAAQASMQSFLTRRTARVLTGKGRAAVRADTRRDRLTQRPITRPQVQSHW
jgi:hypothetical protein